MNRNLFIYLEVAAFIIFLGLGYWVGKNLNPGQYPRVLINHLKPTPSPIPALPDGERILLLVNVDQLDNTIPGLNSMWLITYYLNDQPIQLLPIYPTNINTQQSHQSLILENFAVVMEDGATRLAPTFLNWLNENNYWLSGYVLMDDHASSTMINLIGGLPTDRGVQSGEQIISTIPSTTENSQKAHEQQAMLLGQYCLTLSRLTSPPQWNSILELIPEHLVSDIHPLRLITEIEFLTSDQAALRCEFPALTYLP